MKEIESYSLIADNVPAEIKIIEHPKEFVRVYTVTPPKFEAATVAVLDVIKDKLITEVSVKPTEILDPRAMEEIKTRFMEKADEIISKEFPRLPVFQRKVLAGSLVHEMFGLGNIEILLKDDNLEEVTINNSLEPVWVYHKKYGWLKTNIYLDSESIIQEYASSIGRKVGRQITNLSPLMDAHLITGDRVNSTLFPISTKGNTITIRKFARKPWTITDFMQLKTISKDVAALLWMALQYEFNMIVAGGTASGKTSFLNVLTPFIPPNHRVLSIEDTREIQLPKFLHWLPLTTREPNPEGKGEVNMLTLMINALRMRPDRIIVGEVRRAEEAEVLFEAMHTGHSVYSTIHADTAEQCYRRLVNPPIEVPETLVEALHLIVSMFRDRRRGIRRVFQVAEILPISQEKGRAGVNLNILYRWSGVKDEIVPSEKSYRLLNELMIHTGMDEKEINQDMENKKKVLEWLVVNNINTVDAVGKIIAEYYRDSAGVLDAVEKKTDPKSFLEMS